MKKNNKVAIRYCSKCGCELASDSKHSKCENCRTKAGKTFAAVGTVAIACVVFIPKVIKAVFKR